LERDRRRNGRAIKIHRPRAVQVNRPYLNT
jgi:hypothetical protein